jgi:hypothetical protein
MSDRNGVRRLEILSADQAWERFADLTSDEFLREMKTKRSANVRTYRVPRLTEQKRTLASDLAEFATSMGPGIICITHWCDETPEFVEYRKSLDEVRPLIKAPVHLFSVQHREEVGRLLSFVLELEWDCFVFERELRYLIEISHDGLISLTASNSDFLEKERAHLAFVDLELIPESQVPLDI